MVTTYGKIIFNTIFPNDKYTITLDIDNETGEARKEERYIPFINEANIDNLTDKLDDKYFISPKGNKSIKDLLSEVPSPHPFRKKFLGNIISEVFKHFKLSETSKTLDKMKDLGFKYSTVSGITVAATDIEVVPGKAEVLKVAQEKVDQYEEYYNDGFITEKERRNNVINIWKNAKEQLEKKIKVEVERKYKTNHIFMMSDSGARGNIANFVQLSGMRGLMAKPNGESMDIPIRSSFREGLTMSEFFISTHGARKGSTDTALKTAESGYLTRRLVDVSQDVTVTEEDCHTDKGLIVSRLVDTDGSTIVPLVDRIRGRFISKPILHPKTNKVIVPKDGYINDELAEKIHKLGVEEVTIRSLLTCNAKNGVCVKCYGGDLSTGEIVEKGEVVGIIAAQSIGEPGTQLTMRTFHSGGVAGEDITQGLPRIQELFEAREPKGKAIISDIEGMVESITLEKDNRYEITIKNQKETKTYLTDSGKTAIVKERDKVYAGQRLTEGLIHPKELLKVGKVEDVEKYILKEVQKVYRSQGVEIADKHIEIIIKQMLQKVYVVHEGSTAILPGSLLSKNEIYTEIESCIKENRETPVIRPVLLGINRASLKSDSF